MKTTILLPTYNEEKSIVQTIKEVQIYAPDSDIFVVDSYSTDNTVALAQQIASVKVLQVKGRGKGLAIRRALSLIESDFYIMLDSDFTYPAKHIPEIVYDLETGYDVVMGYRKHRQRGSMPLINLVGNKCLSLLATVVYKTYVRDLCTGMWGLRKHARNCFKLTSNGFTLEADLFKNAVKNLCSIRQIPIEYRARLEDSKTKLNVGHGIEIAKFLIRG